MLLKLIQNLCQYINPNTCLACKLIIEPSLHYLCLSCQYQLLSYEESPWSDKRMSHYNLEVSDVFVLYRYSQNSPIQQLIKSLKYSRQEQVAKYLFLHANRRLTLPQTIDLICCVPIHKKKRKKRGYNQLSLFCKLLAKQLQRPFAEDLFIKNKERKSQSELNRSSREKNESFEISINNHYLDHHKNLLIVDDLITTGATMRNMLASIPKHNSIKISILCLASSVD